jgi:septal ring factor EnvC (AmiA/AmiB activator)
MADEQANGSENFRERWGRLTGGAKKGETAPGGGAAAPSTAAKGLRILLVALVLVLALAAGIWYDTKARTSGLVREASELKKLVDGLQAELADLTHEHDRIKRENKSLKTENEAARADIAQMGQSLEVLKGQKEKEARGPRFAPALKRTARIEPEPPAVPGLPTPRTTVANPPVRGEPRTEIEAKDRGDARSYTIR